MLRPKFYSAPSLLIAAVLLSFALLSSACSSGGSAFERSRIESQPATAPAAELKDYEVQMLDAPGTRLSQLIGKDKVALINFWATWCGPCRQEIPHLVELQKKYRDQGLEVVGLSVEDPGIDAEKVRRFAKEYQINYQLGFSSQEMFAAFNGSDPRMVIPQSFIFDREGNLVKHIKGLNPRFMREILEEGIEKALRTASKTS